MAELRTLACDIKGCTVKATEEVAGEGHIGWGKFLGIRLNNTVNPCLCPSHLAQVAELIDSMEGVPNDLD